MLWSAEGEMMGERAPRGNVADRGGGDGMRRECLGEMGECGDRSGVEDDR